MGDKLYNASNNAAKACAAYSNNGLNDWFLPSRYELSELYNQNIQKNFFDFKKDFIWTSTEYESDSAYVNDSAYVVRLDNGEVDICTKDTELYVRPIRAFKI